MFSPRVAQFETEVRAERILAGQAAARAAGKTWGGGKPGRRVRLSVEKETAIRQLHDQGKSISEISRVIGLSRPTIYRVLGCLCQHQRRCLCLRSLLRPLCRHIDTRWHSNATEVAPSPSDSTWNTSGRDGRV